MSVRVAGRLAAAVRSPVLRELAPRRADYSGLRSSWARDVVAGVTVGIVALPLALAFGVASGVGAAAGLVTAVVAGAVAACFGGSQLQVSGPTGAMTVVLVPLVAAHGPGVVYPVAVLAGVIVLLAAVLRLGRLLNLVPWPLVEGFTLGIAVVISAQQVPHALGVDPAPGENSLAVAADAVGTFVQHPHWEVVGVLCVALVLTAALPRLHRALPASLVAVVVTSLIAHTANWPVPVIGELPGGLPAPSIPQFSDLGPPGSVAGAALAVAFLAALESLLSARVADGMSDAAPHDPDRELFGQGLANIASGLCHGMPATGAIARTAVNARSGAQTRLAALTHAAVLAVVVYALSPVVAHIPLAALAGVLLVTAARMVERSNIRAVLCSTRSDAAVFLVTAAVTAALDLVKAVEAGLALAALLSLYRIAQTARAVVEPWAQQDGADHDLVDAQLEHGLLHEHVLVYRLDGPLFFGVSARFLSEVTTTTDVSVVILRLRHLTVMDATGARALGELIRYLVDRGVTVLLKGPSQEHARLLAVVGAMERGRVPQHHVFDDLTQALRHAQQHVQQEALLDKERDGSATSR